MNFKCTIVIALSLLYGSAYGQVIVNIPPDNIINRTAYQQEFLVGNYSGLLNLLPTISARSLDAHFKNLTTPGGPIVPLNLARINLVSIGSISLLGQSSEIQLSTESQTLATSVANLLSGIVMANLHLPIADHTWVAGNYTSTLEWLAPGLLGLGNRISPATQTLTLQVPAVLDAQESIPPVRIVIDDLAQFRSGLEVTRQSAIKLASTVPYVPSITSSTDLFNFNSSSNYNHVPEVPVSNVHLKLTGAHSTSPVFLSSTTQALTGPEGLPVPPSNSALLDYSFGINSNQLIASFLQAGTYSTPLTYSWDKLSTAYPPTSLVKNANGELEMVVHDLAELKTLHQEVDLSFSSATDFRDGVFMDLPAHVQISKTTPYEVYVRAVSNSFISRSGTENIPLSVLRIGPMDGQTDVQTITLSPISQLFNEGADPTLDRLLNIRYSIPASETGQLLNKPTGSYSTDIIFSLVAP